MNYGRMPTKNNKSKTKFKPCKGCPMGGACENAGRCLLKSGGM